MPDTATEQRLSPSFVSRPRGTTYLATGESHRLSLVRLPERRHSPWTLRVRGDLLTLAWQGEQLPDTDDVLAALEATFSRTLGTRALGLRVPAPLHAELRRLGVLIPDTNHGHVVLQSLLWQQGTLWLGDGHAPDFPVQHVMQDGRRHPLRAPKPAGVVYRRHIPWLNATFSLRVADIDTDLPRFHRWMNDPVVAHFWEEQGELSHHRQYLERVTHAPGILPLIAAFDDTPFGYIEAYWAREDRIAPYYDTDDFDRGWHVLVGDAAFRGKPWLAAWMPSVSHYLFLADHRTRRLVIEPRSDNDRMLRNLSRCGYALVKTFDFPHKHAVLGMLSREHFFNERLWVPAPPHPGAPFSSPSGPFPTESNE